MKRNLVHFALIVGIVALLGGPAAAWAQTAPPLGQADAFGALGDSGVTGAAGLGVLVSGDVGSSPTATIVNFPPSSTVPPWIVHYTNDGVVQQAQSDALAAYNNLAGQGPVTQTLAAQLSGVTLTSGIYTFESAASLATNGTLTLNGGGVFVFQVPEALTANVGSQIVGTADECSVFWQIGTSATLNGNEFWGTVIADASITLGTGADLIGRALAGVGPTGAVTMAGSGGNTIGGCSSTSGECPQITLSPDPLPDGTVGVAYSQQIDASGGTGPYVFTVASGTLPAGLTLSSDGLLSGIPSTAGSEIVTIRAVDDDDGCFEETTFTIVIDAAPPGPEECLEIVLSPATLPAGMVDEAYSQQITASGGTGPYTFEVISGTLPAGLTLTAGGLLSGTPTGVGSSVFTIEATDAEDCPGIVSFTLLIRAADVSQCPPITLSPATLPGGNVGFAYSQQITASGGTGPYTFAVTSGTLPAGMTLSPGGLLSGTPTATVSATVTIEAIDANGCPGERVFDIDIALGREVPTLPQAFVVLLALGLSAAGASRLRRKSCLA
jgi:hypothetical protein